VCGCCLLDPARLLETAGLDLPDLTDRETLRPYFVAPDTLVVCGGCELFLRTADALCIEKVAGENENVTTLALASTGRDPLGVMPNPKEAKWDDQAFALFLAVWLQTRPAYVHKGIRLVKRGPAVGYVPSPVPDPTTLPPPAMPGSRGRSGLG